jgi:hypothetical protein
VLTSFWPTFLPMFHAETRLQSGKLPKQCTSRVLWHKCIERYVFCNSDTATHKFCRGACVKCALEPPLHCQGTVSFPLTIARNFQLGLGSRADRGERPHSRRAMRSTRSPSRAGSLYCPVRCAWWSAAGFAIELLSLPLTKIVGQTSELLGRCTARIILAAAARTCERRRGGRD